MRFCAALSVLVAASCGRVAFDERGDVAVATPDAGGFGAPEPLDELNSVDEDDDPTLTSDELEIYFASRRQGGGDIYFEQMLVATVYEPLRERSHSEPVVVTSTTGGSGRRDSL